jgi:hypothetical protein
MAATGVSNGRVAIVSDASGSRRRVDGDASAAGARVAKVSVTGSAGAGTEARGIEASAVGTVAQCRAKALEVSSKAEPLSASEKPKPVPEVKKEEPPKPAEEDQNKPEPVKSKKKSRKK